MRIALVGCGAIGKVILKAVLENQIPGVEISAVAEVCPLEEIGEMASRSGFPIVKDAEKVLDYTPDLVIEAAEQDVVRRYAPKFLKAKKNLMILSIGALVDEPFLQELMELAQSHGVRLIVPSGAIGGLDTIKSANIAKLTEVSIKNIKPPEALEGAPYILENKINLKSITSPTQIYEGFADEAVKGFPKNLNVTVALSLAGIGPEKTRVVVIVDPSETRNIHEITAKGDFGEAIFKVVGFPSPDNPKTSYLAALSAIATLKSLVSPIQVGT